MSKASRPSPLWFAEKFVSLLIEQHQRNLKRSLRECCDLLKNSYLCLLNNTTQTLSISLVLLWFAEKFVSLLIEQHPPIRRIPQPVSCDLLKNSYLCLLNNTSSGISSSLAMLWFAEKFVSLLIEQHLILFKFHWAVCCDLLKNSYLCLLNNTSQMQLNRDTLVVICWKIRIFAYWTTPKPITINIILMLWFAEKFVSLLIEQHLRLHLRPIKNSCDLLKNSYLCLLNNTWLCRSGSIWECCKQW